MCNKQEMDACFELAIKMKLAQQKDYAEIYKLACAKDYAPACRELAYTVETAEAKKLFDKACALQDAPACIEAIKISCAEHDTSKALSYFDKALITMLITPNMFSEDKSMECLVQDTRYKNWAVEFAWLDQDNGVSLR